MVQNRTRACLAATTALVFVAASQASAQEPLGTPLGRLVLGWGTEQVALDTPQATTVIDQTEIEQSQATTIGELFIGVPGVQAIGSDRVVGQTFNIRGFGEVPAGDEGRVVIQQDGATKYYEQYRLGAFFADPTTFCNIEILRGPASATLYGGGAIGGVIRFETCQASNYLTEGQTSQLRFSVGAESNGAGGNISARFATQPQDNLELLFSAIYRGADDYVDGDGMDVFGSSFTSASILIGATYHIDGSRRIVASIEAWDSDLDDTALDQTDGASIFGTTDRRTQDQTLTVSYEAEEAFGDLDITFSYSNTDVSQTEADAPGIACAPGFLAVLCEVDYGYTTASLDARVTTDLTFSNLDTTLIYGATITRQDRFGETALFGAIPFHPEGTSDRFAVFAQAEMAFDSGLTLVPGLRIEYYSNDPGDTVAATQEETDFVGVSPKLAFTYDVNDRVGLFGSVSQTQRAPTLDELYSFEFPNPTPPFGPPIAGTTPALDLDPETARSVEIGFTYSDVGIFSTNDAFDARVTTFYSRVEDLIENGPDGGPEYLNVDEAEIYGLEIEAAYDAETMFARLAYSNIQGRNITEDEDWDDTPQANLALTLGGRMPDQGLEFGWRANFFQELDVNGTVSPSYAVHDVFFDVRPQDGAFEGLEFRFGIDNIFDATYQNALGSSSDNARGRSFTLTVVRVFDF
ncbi:MAG: TonB-dependent receptor [Pseudomonadota bacterium]